MPTRVQLPDGSVGEFPDGMGNDQIQAVLAKQFPPPGPPDSRNFIQKSFDTETQTNPKEPLLQTGLKSVVGGAGGMFVHPWETAKGMGSALVHSLNPQDPENPLAKTIEGVKADYAAGGLPYAATKAAGNLFGNVAGGTALGAAGGIAGKAGGALAKTVGSGIRDAAIGDPNIAALRGLNISPKSPKTLSTLKSIEGARPYLQGAQSLEDLQSKIGPAKSEIWAPYQQAIEGIGDRPIQGPDGMTTVRELEAERQQLSALNRDLKSKTPNPESVQLAQQKGLNQAQLLAKEKAVKAALLPELAKTGIDPRAILKTFGQVSDIGGKISGKSTLAEVPQPSGFGKMAKLSLEKPLQAPSQIWSGVKDIAAGRPLFEMKPTDVALREAFRTAGPKPNLGQFQKPLVKGLLPAPMESIPLHDPFEEPVGKPSVFDAQINASRTAPPLTTPEGNPNYGYSDRSPGLPPTKGILQQGVLRRRSTK